MMGDWEVLDGVCGWGYRIESVWDGEKGVESDRDVGSKKRVRQR